MAMGKYAPQAPPDRLDPPLLWAALLCVWVLLTATAGYAQTSTAQPSVQPSPEPGEMSRDSLRPVRAFAQQPARRHVRATHNTRPLRHHDRPDRH